jgi:hypothetical protein
VRELAPPNGAQGALFRWTEKSDTHDHRK